MLCLVDVAGDGLAEAALSAKLTSDRFGEVGSAQRTTQAGGAEGRA